MGEPQSNSVSPALSPSEQPPPLAPSISVAASSSSLECFLEWAQKVATLSRVTRYPVQVIKWGWSLCQAPCWGPAGGSAALKVLSTQADTGLFQLPQDSGWGHPLLSTNIASEYSKAEEEQAPHRWGRRNPSLGDHHCTNSEWTRISHQLIQKSQSAQLKDKQEPEANISAKRRPREVDSHAHGKVTCKITPGDSRWLKSNQECQVLTGRWGSSKCP